MQANSKITGVAESDGDVSLAATCRHVVLTVSSNKAHILPNELVTSIKLYWFPTASCLVCYYDTSELLLILLKTHLSQVFIGPQL